MKLLRGVSSGTTKFAVQKRGLTTLSQATISQRPKCIFSGQSGSVPFFEKTHESRTF